MKLSLSAPLLQWPVLSIPSVTCMAPPDLLLRLNEAATRCWHGAGRAFCELLHESDTAFEEVYCIAFTLLDKEWLEQRASYMQFNAVLKEVRAKVDAALQARPKSIQQFRHQLLST